MDRDSIEKLGTAIAWVLGALAFALLVAPTRRRILDYAEEKLGGLENIEPREIASHAGKAAL